MISTTILHVFIALTSIALTTYALIRPTRRILRVSYGLIGLTLASGFYLVVKAPAHMIEACSVGVLYLVVVSVGMAIVKAKLASQGRSLTAHK